MKRVQKMILILITVICLFSTGEVFGGQDPVKSSDNIVLTPADLLILEAIGKVNDRLDKVAQDLSTRIDQVNVRIDNLWITMMGGFIGVLGFIGALVFWDRRTFMRRVKDEIRLESKEDRRKVDGIIEALKKLGTQFPEVSAVLRNFGLL